MKQSIILSIFILGIVFSGCIDSINNKKIDVNSINDTKNVTIKKEQPKEILLKSYDDIYVELYSFDKFSVTDCVTKLTKLQCDDKRKEHVNYVRNNINGHYVKWSGEIVDVGRDPYSYSMIAYVKISGFNKFEKYQWIAEVMLYDIPKEKLIKLNKGDKILFTGKIMELDKGLNGIIGNWKNLKLYDVLLEENAGFDATLITK